MISLKLRSCRRLFASSVTSTATSGTTVVTRAPSPAIPSSPAFETPLHKIPSEKNIQQALTVFMEVPGMTAEKAEEALVRNPNSISKLTSRKIQSLHKSLKCLTDCPDIENLLRDISISNTDALTDIPPPEVIKTIKRLNKAGVPWNDIPEYL